MFNKKQNTDDNGNKPFKLNIAKDNSNLQQLNAESDKIEDKESLLNMFNKENIEDDEEFSDLIKQAKNKNKDINPEDIEDLSKVTSQSINDIKESDFLQDLGDYGYDDLQEKNKITKNKSKKIIKNKIEKSKKKNQKENNSQMVDLGDGVTIASDNNEFEIIQDSSFVGKKIFRGIKIFLSIVLIMIVTAIVYFCMSYKIVPEQVKGAVYKDSDYNFSIISSMYDTGKNLNELKSGDKILCIDEDNLLMKYLPFIYEYDAYTYNSMVGPMLYVTDVDGNDKKIEITNVTYIVSSNSSN